MNAEEVIRNVVVDPSDLSRPLWLATLEALRAAVGGGPVVILEDGTLATLGRASDEIEAGIACMRFAVVPVGGERP